MKGDTKQFFSLSREAQGTVLAMKILKTPVATVDHCGLWKSQPMRFVHVVMCGACTLMGRHEQQCPYSNITACKWQETN